MPFLHTELVLFQPARNVVFGMPIFVGDDSKALRDSLRYHGASRDDPAVWCAALAGTPPHWMLRVEFNRAGSKYARILMRSAGSAWRRDLGSLGDDPGTHHKRDAAVLELPRVWWVKRGAKTRAISAKDPAQMRAQAGFWFPCDGAAAFDLSDLPRKPVLAGHATALSELALFEPTLVDPSASTWVSRFMAQRGVVAALRARAECCFLFLVASRGIRAGVNDRRAIEIGPLRESALPNRRGRLLEAKLRMPMALDELSDSES